MDGAFKIAVVSPRVTLANPQANVAEMVACARAAAQDGVAALAFPELSLTGYSCGDLFFRADLQLAARAALDVYVRETADLPLVSVLGLPYRLDASLYNVAAVVSKGKIWGLVPKSVLPTYGEYYERRQFTPAPAVRTTTPEGVPFGTDLVFEVSGFRFSVELCEDLWMPCPPSSRLAGAGLDLVFNLSASTDFLGKSARRRERVVHQSVALGCAYAMASAGPSESTTDAVFGGHGLVAAGGTLLAESPLFEHDTGCVAAVVDFAALRYRRLSTTSMCETPRADFLRIAMDVALSTSTSKRVSQTPFLDEYGEPGWESKVLDIQAAALRRRLDLTRIQKLVIGVSGGADSALALLGAHRTLVQRGQSPKDLVAVVMPGFGSTSETQRNAAALAEGLGCTVQVIDIQSACRQHLADIGHDGVTADITFENVQARERTQVLMDLANRLGALVVGTGDLSEIALGWNTYNGDHMSMYQINGSVPKTMVLGVLAYFAKGTDYSDDVRAILGHIAVAPITPELVPGASANDSEARLGPYTLHDFFLYHFLSNGAEKEKLLELARIAFQGVYADEMIVRTCDTFIRRFFAAQYKRNCMPDGPKITLTLSPRADWRCPSEVSVRV